MPHFISEQHAPATTATPSEQAATTETLEQFLSTVERRALHMAWLATQNRDEALDMVQDSMLAFVRKYRDCPAAERRPLFYRILNNRLRDWGRRKTVRSRWLSPWLHWRNTDDGGESAAQWEPPDHAGGPEQSMADSDFIHAAHEALKRLPQRQREAFLLREWEGLDVAATASAMGVSTGSVKTHYFRAVHSLRAVLEAYR